MNGIEQQQEPQPSTRTAPKKRTWANEGPSTLQGVGTDYVDDAGEQRPAKRARTHHVIEVAEVVEEQPATKRTLSKSSTSQPHKRITRPLSRPSLRYSSSEEDVSEQRSRQNPRFESLRQLAFPLSETPAQYQLGHISATEVGEQRPVQAGATPNNTSTTPRNFLTPKSARSQSKAQLSPKAVFEPSMAQLSKYDPKAFAQSSYKSYFRDHERAKPAILPDAYDYPDPPNDPILREKYLEERFGDKLPRPRRNYAFNQDKKKPLKEVIRLGKKSYAHYELLKSIEADEEEDIIEAEGGDGPEYTAQALARYRNPPKFDREKFPFPIPPQSTDPPEVS